MADAVPGWFQPVMAVYDAHGKEVAYDDDYRFKPDPVIFFEVPKDGEYLLHDLRRHLPRPRGFRLSRHDRRVALRDEHLPLGRPGGHCRPRSR